MRLADLAPLVLALTSACCAPRPAPPPGYSGTIPSGPAQQALKALSGRTFTDADGTFGGGEWKLGGFLVDGTGPSAILWRPSGERRVPLETDGDVGDFIRRVTGEAPVGIGGPLGGRYRAHLAGK